MDCFWTQRSIDYLFCLICFHIFPNGVDKILGEDESHIRARLLKLEIEQPDMKEGWKNELQSAMRDVDEELVKVSVNPFCNHNLFLKGYTFEISFQEVIEGSSDDPNKHDVDLSSSFNDNWEKIEEQATLLGIGELSF